MFQRQWFPPDSQIGITQEALKFESYLIRKKFSKARSICIANKDQNISYWKRQYYRLQRIESHGMNRYQHVSVSFSGFWPDFSSSDNQLLDFIKLAAQSLKINLEVVSSQEADINFYSCYGNISYCNNSATKVIFLGENVRPSYQLFDYSLGFDRFEAGTKNIYLPLWNLEIDFFNHNYPDRVPIAVDKLIYPFKVNHDDRQDSIVFIGNNAEPFREHVLNLLQSSGIKVDRFGSQTKPVTDKNHLISNYNLSLCFENSYHPGYVTEKLIHSLVAGCKSLYFGGTIDESFANHPLVVRLSPHMSNQSILSVVNSSLKRKGVITYPQIISKEAIDSIKTNIAGRIGNILKLYCF